MGEFINLNFRFTSGDCFTLNQINKKDYNIK